MIHRRMMVISLIAVLLTTHALSDEHVRIATYNIEWLSSETTQCGFKRVVDVRKQGDRLSRLRAVIELMDADIIGLQEIRDRKALEVVFGSPDWTIVIDDESGDCQDLALAVRQPLEVVGASQGKLNAESDHFLFDDLSNHLFPRNRDVLCVEVRLPGNAGSLHVMVHHAKSRYGGRYTTNGRRVGAARELLQKLEQDFHETDFVLLGDFNDNPDDASLNILETGDPNAASEMENEPGAFLVNLTEPLVAAGHVSHGREASDIHDGRVDTIDAASRQRNYDHRDDDSHTGDILFDQLLVPDHTHARYVLGSVAVLDQPVAVQGQSDEMASDHLPVYADFIFHVGDEEDPVLAAARIIGLLPNPVGEDAGHEAVVLRNLGQDALSLEGWELRDKAGNTYALSGSIDVGATLTITMGTFSMPLNNSGDEISLLDGNGALVDTTRYTASQVQPGAMIAVGE